MNSNIPYFVVIMICLIGMVVGATLSLSVVPEEDDGVHFQSGELVGLKNGTSVTVFEKSGDVLQYTMTIEQLEGQGSEFYTWGYEIYSITSDGENLTIKCYRNAYYDGTQVGNNIVAVRLNGVPGFDDGIWASDIVNFTLGYNGIEESLENALGPDSRIGPYGDSTCTYLGDQYSSITLAFRIPSE